MTSHNLPQEFLLAVACCRWPLSEDAIAAIRAAHNDEIDWPYFLRIVKRQRIAGLVHNALSSMKIALPPNAARRLASEAEKIARRGLLLAAEEFRLQGLFDAARIPVVFVKGATLAQLAYGSLALKHGGDIDLLVAPEDAEAALQLLEREAFTLVEPVEHIGVSRRRAVIRYGRVVGVVDRRRNLRVDLHWRLVGNPFLLKGVDAHSPTQNVLLSSGVRIRTLCEPDLFAYLCVHGADHAWSRLKWLADLNALMAGKSGDEIARLYRHAETKGAGLCAGQGLLLCERFLDLKLPASLKEDLSRSRRLKKLQAIAVTAMVGNGGATELHESTINVARNLLMLFLLGRGWQFFAAQCWFVCIGLVDVIRYPLPAALHFLYPVLRLPFWLWRWASSGGAIRGGRRNGPGPRA